MLVALVACLAVILSACQRQPDGTQEPKPSASAGSLEIRIAAGDDDAEERISSTSGPGRVSLGSSDLELVQDTSNQTVGLRFRDVKLPAGATLQGAYVQFTADESHQGATTLTLAGEASGSAVAFTHEPYNLSSRKRTGSSVAWQPAPWTAGERAAAQRSPDLTAIVREVLQLPGSADGHDLVLLITGSGRRSAVAFNGNPQQAASLHLSYATDGAPPPPPPDPDPDPEPNPDPEPGANITLPARGAFYYPWFPETWTVGGKHVAYHPDLGYYTSDAATVAASHVQALERAQVNVAIASWWGPDTHKEATRLPLLFSQTQEAQADLKWALYYEKEGFGNPPLSELRSDLAYLKGKYAASPVYARVDDRPVLFVYNADDTGCAVVDRWLEATQGQWYLVLKVFAGYRNCAQQPDDWHQYAPASPTDHQAGHSYAISPGFWRADEAGPRLARDLARWRDNVAAMVASGEPWQLITTFNEWGEGTAVEAAHEWGASYLDALAGATPAPTPVSVSVQPNQVTLAPGQQTTLKASVTGSSNTGVTWSTTGGAIGGSGNTITYTAPGTAGTFQLTATSVADTSKKATAIISVRASTGGAAVRFAAAGDFGGRDDRAGKVMNDVKARDASAFMLLGDMSYDEISPESAWCDWVHSYLGANYPMELVAGNHEEDSRVDGHIRQFTACMPDRLNSSMGPGGYGINFAFDLGPVTVVATAPDLEVDNVHYGYGSGSPERQWLLNSVRSAKSEGDWVVVGMHKNCVTMGQKSCEIGQSFAQLLIEEGVDLVLQGHDHTYQRSHALNLVQPNTVPPGAIADDGGDGVYARGAGTVFVIVGSAGRSLYACSHSDAEAAYFVTHYCAEESSSTKGYLLVDASSAELSAQFIATAGSFSDRFTIR